ncbi:auxin-responsive protein IAA4-like [Phalaenopsis equestris]|uniref:auxin-responsive protein IAA4-like n=1 Tax=Phalaenopsis equestris TaxID=78828 RepID=UPI0009E61488|nr:auxin-responsive protein IAA4-like [Phalaenopsis equestris]
MDGNCDNLEDTELRLGLPGIDVTTVCSKVNKRALTDDFDLKRPSAKAQVVGWPPVRSNRRNSIQARRSEAAEIAGAGIFLVKVSMDGAPYLRKIDLMIYKGYKELRNALENMFKYFPFGSLECENLEVEATSGTEYAVAYEDKDGDWMLAGDVPWEMFISSCRRLRIMKGSEAMGLAPHP